MGMALYRHAGAVCDSVTARRRGLLLGSFPVMSLERRW